MRPMEAPTNTTTAPRTYIVRATDFTYAQTGVGFISNLDISEAIRLVESGAYTWGPSFGGTI